jgi:hypothetical protein
MATIRQLLSKLTDHIDYIHVEDLESGQKEAISIIEDIESIIDTLEYNNNEIKAIAEDLRKSDKMRDIADEILEPSEIIGKMVY